MATYYWVGGTGYWHTGSNWSASSGGSGGAGVPTSSDDVIFDANSDSGTAFSAIIDLGITAQCRSLTATAIDQTLTIDIQTSLGGFIIYGSIYLPSSGFQISNPFSKAIGLSPVSGSVWDTKNYAIPANLDMATSSVEVTLQSNFQTTKTFTFNGGTLNLGSYTLTCGGFSSTGNSVRTFNFNTGELNISGGVATWFAIGGTNGTITGSGDVVITATSGSGSISCPAPLVSIYVPSGSPSITFSGSTQIKTLDFTGSTASTTWTGSVLIEEHMRMGGATGTCGQFVVLNGSSSTYDFSPGSVNFTSGISISGNYILQSNMTIGGYISLSQGSFDANNKNVQLAFFESNTTTTRTFNMGSGTWTLTGSFGNYWNVNATNLTFSGGNAPITVRGNGSFNFYGGGLTYKSLNVVNTSAPSTTTIYGNNTFETISSSTAFAFGLTFESGSTTTVSQFLATGQAGKTLTIRSTTPGSAATLLKNNGNINIDYTDIQDSTTAGSSVWYAGANSVNSGNNTGWVFGPGSTGSMLSLIAGLV